MKAHSVAEKAAAYLVASEEFRKHGYTAVSGVRVKDILLNGTALQGDEALDLLVCDGNRVLIGIVYRMELVKTFYHNMFGLPFVRIPKADTALPLFPDDDGWMDFPSEACLESLLKNIMESLSHDQRGEDQRRGKSLASFRKRRLRKFTLPAVPPEQIIDKESHNALGLYQKMAAKKLLRSDFTPTPYGNAHGLFLRYHVDPFGDVSPELLTVPAAVKDIRAVLSRQKRRANRMSLAERVKCVKDITAVDHYDVPSAIKGLLDTPVNILFRNRDEDLQQLLSTLEHSRFLLTGGKAAGKSAKSMPVYREVLETIDSLRQGFSDEPLLDDYQGCRMRRACETLLVLLSALFLRPSSTENTVPEENDFVKKQSLRERLGKVHGQFGFRLFGIPLAGYYQTISRLSECEYPNWVYQTRIKPVFNDTGKPETDYTLRFLAAYCKLCLEDNGAHDWDEAFPLLLDLITIPLCVKQH